MDHLWFCVFYLIVSIPDPCTLTYFVLLKPFRLFIAALRSPAGKGLTSWLLLVMFIVLCYFLMWYPGLGVVLDCIVS